MTRAFVQDHMRVRCYDDDRGATSLTPSGRRELLTALIARCEEIR